jgi:uncharacterized protein
LPERYFSGNISLEWHLPGVIFARKTFSGSFICMQDTCLQWHLPGKLLHAATFSMTKFTPNVTPGNWITGKNLPGKFSSEQMSSGQMSLWKISPGDYLLCQCDRTYHWDGVDLVSLAWRVVVSLTFTKQT